MSDPHCIPDALLEAIEELNRDSDRYGIIPIELPEAID